MKKKILTLTLLILSSVLITSQLQANWKEDLLSLISSNKYSEELLTNICKENPAYNEVISAIQNVKFSSQQKTDIFIKQMYKSIDGVSRPYVIYIPPKYNVNIPSKLLVYLHGGINRKNIIDNPIKYAEKNEFIPYAKLSNMMMLFPFGQSGATWWDNVGFANIKGEIINVKKQFNINDDNVALCGFSDGGSASYALAMLQPDIFSCFVPLNGHIGVASIDGNLPLYVSNLSTTSLFVVNTDKDPLYPSAKMLPMIRLALSAGADLRYKIYLGIEHEFTYSKAVMPSILEFIDTHPRDPFPIKLNWESSREAFNKRLWLQIDKVSDTQRAAWHKDYNLELEDTQIVFGFFPDDKFKGKGIKVEKLSKGNTLCNSLKMLPEDIILEADNQKISKLEDLNTFKKTKKRGDLVKLVIERKGKKLKLKGHLPPPEKYSLFKLENSGKVIANKRGNSIFLELSRISECSILVNSQFFQLEQPIKVYNKGRIIFNSVIKPDIKFTIKDFLKRRDRKVVYCNQIKLKIRNNRHEN